MKGLIYRMFQLIRRVEASSRDRYFKSLLDIHPTARVGGCHFDRGNISVGRGTYIRSGEIVAGPASVSIGKYCAIGANVSIRARSHDLRAPTATETRQVNGRVWADITIGNYVWIGNNVFIKHGVTVHDHAIIGANSVVVRDVPARAIVGGVPAKIIRFNDVLEFGE